MPGRGHHLAHPSQGVELLGLRVELDGEPHAALGRHLADLTDALGRAPKVAVPLVDGAHHGDTAERRGTLALLVEHLEQTPALRALGVHPAELDPDARDGKAARPDRKSTRLNSSHRCISYAVFCLKKK